MENQAHPQPQPQSTVHLLATIADLQSRLHRLETKEVLTSLLHTYARACDHGDSALFSTLYMPDGTMSSPAFGTLQGRTTLAEGIASGRGYGGLMHSITNIEFVLPSSPLMVPHERRVVGPAGSTDRETATATAYLSFYAVPDARKRGDNFAFGGLYEFEFVRNRDGSDAAIDDDDDDDDVVEEDNKGNGKREAKAEKKGEREKTSRFDGWRIQSMSIGRTWEQGVDTTGAFAVPASDTTTTE